MSKFFAALIAGIFLASAAVFAASFEGRVNFTMTSGQGQPQHLSYQMKNGRIRVEMPGQSAMGGMIIDPARRESTVIMTEQRMYMVTALPDVVAQAAEAKAGGAKLEKTGRKEKLLGYDAAEYTSTINGVKTILWLAEGLGSFMALGGGNPLLGGAPAGEDWESALAGKELFPLRVVTKDTGGKETFRMEATAIEKQTLSDALFAPPAGFQKLDMGGMMQGLMPGLGK